jgi:hypothetical protein
MTQVETDRCHRQGLAVESTGKEMKPNSRKQNPEKWGMDSNAHTTPYNRWMDKKT